MRLGCSSELGEGGREAVLHREQSTAPVCAAGAGPAQGEELGEPKPCRRWGWSRVPGRKVPGGCSAPAQQLWRRKAPAYRLLEAGGAEGRAWCPRCCCIPQPCAGPRRFDSNASATSSSGDGDSDRDDKKPAKKAKVVKERKVRRKHPEVRGWGSAAAAAQPGPCHSPCVAPSPAPTRWGPVWPCCLLWRSQSGLGWKGP